MYIKYYYLYVIIVISIWRGGKEITSRILDASLDKIKHCTDSSSMNKMAFTRPDVHYIDDKSVNFGESLLFTGDGSVID